ncbi:MAG: 16S rRNA (guanine(527)-N(7))-methyltransferase RsmG [Cytophagales bacterium]|nr:16S rRNA (guanine(527)-N(7))-methyltransferase RsmG [Cytophagales bacterium]
MELLHKYFPDLTEQQIEHFTALETLYKEWNEKINVISRKDIDALYERHILHSLAIAKVITFKEGTKILDVGTGGGFPGIPLAILFPDVQFHLIDSIGKKITVVQGIISSLNLENCKAEQIRAEKIKEKYDFVTCRGVTRLGRFMAWVRTNIHNTQQNSLKNGVICLKGGDLEEELTESKRKYKMHDINAFFEEEFFDTKKVIHVPI